MEPRLKRKIIDNEFLIAAAVIAAVWVLLRIKSVIVLVFISFILTMALLPLVEWLKKHRFPGPLAVLTPVALTAAAVSLGMIYIVPQLLREFGSFANNLPAYLSRLPHITGGNLSGQLNDYVRTHASSLGGEAFGLAAGLLGMLIAVVTVVVITIYWLLDYYRIKTSLSRLLAPGNPKAMLASWDRVEEKIGAWIRGQLILSAAIGVMVWIAYWAAGLPFAIILALLAAALEVLPGIGPIIAAVPAVLIALAISPGKAVVVLIIYTLIHMVEANIMAPLIMGRAVKMHPLLIMLSLVIGGELAGLQGAFLAVPTALLISAIAETAFHRQQAETKAKH